MSDTGLYNFLPQNRFLGVRPLLWSAAWTLAKLRTSSNGRRLQHRNRGRKGNLKGDLVGAFGELLVYFFSCHSGQENVIRHIRGTIYDRRGGAGLSSVADAPRLDVKGFDFSPRKDFLAINQEKHRKLSTEIDHYYFIFAPPLSREIFVSTLVPWKDVGTWPSFSLGIYGDPSLNLDLKSFYARYAKAFEPEKLRGNRHDPEKIKGLKNRGEELLSEHFSEVRLALSST